MIRYILLTFAQRRSPTRKEYVYICIFLNTSSSFQLSLSLKHTSQVTFVCGCSVMISVASQRCFCYVAVFLGGAADR